MKRVFVLIALLFLCSCKSKSQGWTKEDEQETYDQCYSATTKIFTNEIQRKQFATYVVKRFKSELPNGLSSISKDSLGGLYKRIVTDFAKLHLDDNLSITVPWTVSFEKSFRDSLINKPYIKKMPLSERNKACDCMILELKKLNPGFVIMPMQDSTVRRIKVDCKIAINN